MSGKYESGADVQDEGSAGSGNTSSIMAYINSEKDNAKKYYDTAMKMFSGIGSGLITPSIDGKQLNSKIEDYEKNSTDNLMMNEAMILAGRYSALKTGDSTAFMQAMAARGKTLDDFMKFNDSVRTYVSPTANRMAKIASASYIQKAFGIDVDKDFAELNRASLQVDALKAEMGKSLMAMGANSDSNYMKMMIGTSSKQGKTDLLSGDDIKKVSASLLELGDRIDSLTSDGRDEDAGELKKVYSNLVKRLNDIQGFAMTTREASGKE